jgi:hypothetical protein
VGIPVVQAFGMELTISALTHSVKFNTMVDFKVSSKVSVILGAVE